MKLLRGEMQAFETILFYIVNGTKILFFQKKFNK